MGGGHGVREKCFKVEKSDFLSSKTKFLSQTWFNILYYKLDLLRKFLDSLSRNAGVAQLVEHHLAKVDVEGSNPFARSILT
jgi:hypothetical protein